MGTHIQRIFWLQDGPELEAPSHQNSLPISACPSYLRALPDFPRHQLSWAMKEIPAGGPRFTAAPLLLSIPPSPSDLLRLLPSLSLSSVPYIWGFVRSCFRRAVSSYTHPRNSHSCRGTLPSSHRIVLCCGLSCSQPCVEDL